MIGPPSVKPLVSARRGRLEVAVGDPVVALAGQALVAPDVVQAARELVGAALGHRVDVGAGVALLRDVVVAQVDLHRLDGVDGDRLLGVGRLFDSRPKVSLVVTPSMVMLL
jgi:hypothetical protein